MRTIANCVNCSRATPDHRKGLCRPCCAYLNRTGKPRPFARMGRGWHAPIVPCFNDACDRMSDKASGVRCIRCRSYFRKHGIERPAGPNVTWKKREAADKTPRKPIPLPPEVAPPLP